MRIRPQSFSRLVIVLVGLWCLGFTAGPAVESALFGSRVASSLYQGICHQDPERSFSWFGSEWAVCHRCSAIYLTFAVVAVGMIVTGRYTMDSLPRPWVIALLLGPVALDGIADLAGVWSSGLISRLGTGALTGAVLALVVLPALFDAMQKLHALEPYPSSGGHDV